MAPVFDLHLDNDTADGTIGGSVPVQGGPTGRMSWTLVLSVAQTGHLATGPASS
jgi:hypothetical protein